MNNNLDLPLVSFVLTSYNQEKYIQEAISGALTQTYSPLEIIISDDCSTDNTFKIIQQTISLYRGKHIVTVNRNENNLGIGEHLNKIIEMASGEFIICAAGDDISLPTRVDKLVNTWLNSNRRYKSIFTNAIRIDEFGVLSGSYFKSIPIYAKTLNDFIFDKRSFRIRTSQPAVWQLGATAAFEKSLFNIYGRVDSRAIQEDGIYAFRALLQGEICYIDKSLVKYRIHSSSVSNMNNPKSLKRFIVFQCYYKLTQLNDAKLTHFSNVRLVNKLKCAFWFSKSKRVLYLIPYYPSLVFYSKDIVKRALKYVLFKIN